MPIWARLLLAISLAGNAGSGVGWYSQDDSDRYYGATAARDLTLRDQKINRNITDIDKLEARMEYFTKRIQEESREAEDDLKSHVDRSHK